VNLASRNNLALTYQAAGRLDEAIPLLERTVTDCEQVLGETHPSTLTLRNNLAAVYQAAGRLDLQLGRHGFAMSDKIATAESLAVFAPRLRRLSGRSVSWQVPKAAKCGTLSRTLAWETARAP